MTAAAILLAGLGLGLVLAGLLLCAAEAGRSPTWRPPRGGGGGHPARRPLAEAAP